MHDSAIVPPDEATHKAIFAYQESLSALVEQSCQEVFDPLEIHCCIEDLKEAFNEVLRALEIH